MRLHLPTAQGVFLILLAVLSTGAPLCAQTVFIPDTNMRNWLNGYGPGCVDASGWFDPMHPEIVNDTAFSLTIGSSWDPTGLEALHNARHMSIGGEADALSEWSIAAFPDSLRSLRIELVVGITNIVQSFPPLLTHIELDGAGPFDQSVPWPPALKELSIQNCTMPGLAAFPPGLRALFLLGLPNLDEVPALGQEVKYFKVQDCPLLSELPTLPPSAEDVWLEQLPLVTAWPALDMWPPALRTLWLAFMNITDPMPFFPAGLESVVLKNMPGSTALPELSDSLVTLTLIQCESLTALPDRFPLSLESLELTFCPLITCLPWLHDSMYVYVEFSGIDCLPNIPLNDFFVNPSFLLSRPCTIYGPECSVSGITGETYVDSDGDGVHDTAEPAYPYATIQLDPGGVLCSSDSTGRFNMGPGPGDFTMMPVAQPYVSSVVPSQHEASLATMASTDSLNDFGYTLVANVQDLRVDFYRMSARSGFMRPAWLTVRNVGTVPISATAVLTLDTLDQFVSSDVPPTTVDGQTLFWDLGEIPPGMIRVVELSLLIPAGTQFGLPIVHQASVLPLVGDLMPGDNTITAAYTTINGMDPNDKLVSPRELTPGQVLSMERLTYTINFQNTGNYLADRVVITDTLSEDLQTHTIELLSSSHEVRWSLVNGVLVFIFDNIFLPDSTTDELGSHGFVRFAMRPVADLQVGEQISNVANIYFDFNEPVITAPAIVTVTEALGVGEQWSQAVKVFPDPAQESLFVQCDGAKGLAVWDVYDMFGKRALSGSILGPLGRIDLGALQVGAYVLHLSYRDGLRSTRFLKR